MTNFEKMMKDNIELIKKALENNIAVTNGKPVLCGKISCDICDYDFSVCREKAREWLDAEYKESIELNEQERLLCEMIEDGYLQEMKMIPFGGTKRSPSKVTSDGKILRVYIIV